MASVQLVQNQLEVEGVIDFQNANAIYQAGLNLLAQHKTFPVYVDLSKLTHGNTLALAVCIQWLRHCSDMQSLKLVSVPSKMQGIIRASNLNVLMQD